MTQSEISFSTGIGLTVFMTILLGSALILNIILGIKSIIKPYYTIVTVVSVPILFYLLYSYLLFWTTIRVYDSKTLEITTKTVFGYKTQRYENITKVRLYLPPKGGYALNIYQKGKEDRDFKGGFGYKSAKALVPFFEQTQLPFETKLFQRK